MHDPTEEAECPSRSWRPTRREVLGIGGLLLAGGGALSYHRWHKGHENGHRADVCIARATDYDATLMQVVADGLRELGVGREAVRGKRILLKPNLVETAVGQPHINTSPEVVRAVIVAFRRLDARQVVVAEGQGHRRDSWLVLDESGMRDVLKETGTPFVDLNHDEPVAVRNPGRWTSLKSLYLPKTVLAADWLVSLPKLKTHHWAGVTCAMKNLFGVMPGLVYGWPKNVLHHNGISNSILDINTTVRSALAIVDGVVGMEGDGPIMGSPKRAGCLIMGRNLPAVDATAVRVMGLNPYGVDYLSGASGRLGPIREANITQLGEAIEAVRTRFSVLDVPHLRSVHSA